MTTDENVAFLRNFGQAQERIADRELQAILYRQNLRWGHDREIPPYDPAGDVSVESYIVAPHECYRLRPDIVKELVDHGASEEDARLHFFLCCYRFPGHRLISVSGRDIWVIVPRCISDAWAPLREMFDAIEPVLHRRFVQEDELHGLLRRRRSVTLHDLLRAGLEPALRGGNGKCYFALRDAVTFLRKCESEHPRVRCVGCRLVMRSDGPFSEWRTIRGPVFISRLPGQFGRVFCTKRCRDRMRQRERQKIRAIERQKQRAREQRAARARQRSALREGARTLREIREFIGGQRV